MQRRTEDASLGPRLLLALGAIGLMLFEGLYHWLAVPTGPLWLRVTVVSLCMGYVVALQILPRLRPFAHTGAAILAVVVTAENVYRMHVVDFAFAHSMPMLVVIAGASYAFRHYSHMALFLLGSATALTLTMLATPNAQVTPYIYIAGLWIFCLLTFMVFGTRVREHNQIEAQERVLAGVFEGSLGGLLLFRGDDLELVVANDRARELLGALSTAEPLDALTHSLGLFLGVPANQVMSQVLVNEFWHEEVPFGVAP